MDIKFYPYPTHLLNNYRSICGQHAGILESSIAVNNRRPEDVGLYSLFGKMPNYHKVIIHPDSEVEYHLVGYGLYFEESLIRLLGEGIERYALMVAPNFLRDQIKYASYYDIQKEGVVIPWELMNIYSDEDYNRLNNRGLTHLQKLDKNSIIGWISCPSLLETGKEVWIPAQMLFTGYKIDTEISEKRFIFGYSKGSSAHTDFKKALLNAILETIEVDPFIVKWYTMKPSIYTIVYDYTLINALPGIFGENTSFEVLPLLLNLEDTPGYVFGVTLINKKEENPFIVFGSAASLDPVKGLYRALTEAAAITKMGDFGPVFNPDSYFKFPKDDSFTDLDKNVAYYLFPQEASKKREIFKNLTGSSLPLSGMKNLSTGD